MVNYSLYIIVFLNYITDRYPDVLTKVKSSTIRLAKMMKAEKILTRDYILTTILDYHLGITDATEDEIHGILDSNDKEDIKELDQYLAELVSFRAQLGVKKSLIFFLFSINSKTRKI